MATSNAAFTDDKPVQLIPKEDIKKETVVPIEFVPSGESECVLCVSKSNENFDIFTQTTVSGTPLHIFVISYTYTNTKLPFSENLPKYICKKCVDLINGLELAKMEYIKLKNSFDRIIRENPLFHEHAIEEDSQSKDNQGIDKWVLDKVKVELEPMAVGEAVSHGHTELDTKTHFGRVKPGEDSASGSKCVNEETNSQPKCQADVATQTGEKKKYECTICHRWFNTKSQLNTHSVTHTGDKPFECNVCQRRFSLKGNLRSHMRIHTGEKPYNCDLCQRQFSELTNFRYHVRTHTGQKPFQCDICHVKFISVTHLKVHSKKHTGERPFKCHICQQAYVEKRNLERHVMKTHGKIQE